MGRRRNEPDLYYRDEVGVWYTSFYDHRGKRQRRSTHQSDRALALGVARRIQQEFFERKGRATTLETVLAEFIARAERDGRATATLAFYVKKATVLTRILGAECEVNTLSLADTEGYVDVRDGEGVARATIRKELNVLVWALQYARKHVVDGQRLYDGDGKDIMPSGLGGAYVPGERALTQDEYRGLRAALSEERRAYLDAFVGLGVRDSELYAIRPSDVAEDGSVVHVPGTKTDGADRIVNVTPTLRTMLVSRAKVRRGEPSLFPVWTNVRRDLHVACGRAGIGPVSPNDLRRTFASWLAEAGVPEMGIAQMMGHTSSAMVRRVYAKIGSAAKADAAAKLPPLGDVRVPLTEPTPPVRGTATSVAPVISIESARSRRTRGPSPVTDAVSDRGASSGQGGHPGRSAPTKKAAEERPFGVPGGGIEPPTRGFSIPCSTN